MEDGEGQPTKPFQTPYMTESGYAPIFTDPSASVIAGARSKDPFLVIRSESPRTMTVKSTYTLNDARPMMVVTEFIYPCSHLTIKESHNLDDKLEPAKEQLGLKLLHLRITGRDYLPVDLHIRVIVSNYARQT